MTHLKDLVPDPQNRRAHNARNLGLITDALHQVGAARSIVIDEDNVILAGNGVTEAAADAGITAVRVIEASGSELIAVRRSGLTPEQKRALALFDNRTAELATWNVEQLQADLDAGLSLAPWWTDDEVAALLAQQPKPGRTDPDAVPEERATEIQRGDLFELGAHRLLCGDCTQIADVTHVIGVDQPLLMATDPPYGISLDMEWRDRAGLNVHGPAEASYMKRRERYGNREISGDSRVDWADAFALVASLRTVYVWHASKFTSEVLAGLQRIGYEHFQQIIWNKPIATRTRTHYWYKHEPCWYARKKNAPWYGKGGTADATVWDAVPPKHIFGGSEEDKFDHPTQKPVALFVTPLTNHTVPGESCYEPFCGSGTALMAAEQLGRRCFAMELEPRYVQVAIDRWEAFTGQTARKVGEAVRS